MTGGLILPVGAAAAAGQQHASGLILPYTQGTPISSPHSVRGVRSGSTKVLVRNSRGLPLMCCYTDCTSDGDNRIRVEVPHNQPKFPGEKLIYIFCKQDHKRLYLLSSPYADRA